MLLSVLIAGVDLAFPFVTRKAMNQLLPHKLYSAFFAVIENQGISEIGTRQELLARGGVYASLERAQEIGG